MKKVLGMGNALVDVLIRIHDDSLLQKFGLPKGSMQLVDLDKSRFMQESMRDLNFEVASGGSAANTINGLANLGAPCGYIGKISNDQNGAHFRADMTSKGIEALLLTGSQPTGVATTLISSDSQRTFGTYLGSAVELSASDLNPEFFHGYDILHIEGYLVQNHQLLEKAVILAKEAGLKIAMDMASYNIVAANLDFLQSLVRKYVDILFANEEESMSFTGKEPLEALDEIAGMCEIAVVKIGAKGCLVKVEGKVLEVPAIAANPVDTTGAGDLYASGFFYGLANNLSYEKCARLGSLLAGNVIEVIGTKMDENRWANIKREVEKISG
jgi:sugar/nucleoside kinase (ribokinase family)